jgi:hypothetical protein
VGSSTEVHVLGDRLRLTDSDLLRKLMLWAPDGPLTAKSLSTATGLSLSKVYALLSGERPTVGRETATTVASLVGVHLGALFFEVPPTPVGVDIYQEEA